jgi:hypothetical protein
LRQRLFQSGDPPIRLQLRIRPRGFTIGEFRFRRRRLGFIGFPVATEPDQKAIADPLAPMPVVDPALEYGPEQCPPFRGRAIGIFLDQFEHGILDDIQCVVPAARGQPRESKGTLLDAGQKFIQRFAVFQLTPLIAVCLPDEFIS